MRSVAYIAIPLGVLSAMAYAFSSVHWVGSHSAWVEVLIADASTLTPIPNATVTRLEGTQLIHDQTEIPIDSLRELQLEKLMTDELGRTRFEHKFFAYGSRSLFHDTGYVEIDNLWLRVTADGYCMTYMPVDGQSISTRDIQNMHSVSVTVPVGKLAANN